MNASCISFRAVLEHKLAGGQARGELSQLAWHEHLLSCSECRNLLEAEEALEILLATLPEPRLPSELARRVIARLQEARQADAVLDALLDLDREASAPAGLSADVLARLQPERERVSPGRALDPIELQEARLDALLESDREIAARAGLSSRVLAALASARLAAHRDALLDSLLTRDREIAAPDGLAERVLDHLKPQRSAVARARSFDGATAHSNTGPSATARSSSRSRRTAAGSSIPRDVQRAASSSRSAPSPATATRAARILQMPRSRWLYPLAASLLAAFVAWAVWPRHKDSPHGSGENMVDSHGVTSGQPPESDPARAPDAPRPIVPEVAVHTDTDTPPDHIPAPVVPAPPALDAPPDPQMLAALDVLEQWDLLMGDNVDVLLSTLEPADEAVLEYHEGDPSTVKDADKPEETPSVERKPAAKKG